MTRPGSMDVQQETFTNGLKTVASNKLDAWIMNTLQPSPAFCRQVKQTVKQICDFLKEDCFETGIRVHKTVKVSAARLRDQPAPLPSPFSLSCCSSSCPASGMAAPGMVAPGMVTGNSRAEGQQC